MLVKTSFLLGWVSLRDRHLSNKVLFSLALVNRSPFLLVILPTCLYHNFVPFTLR